MNRDTTTRRLATTSLLAALVLTTTTAQADNSKEIPTARLDLTSGLLLTKLPHGKPFHLTAEATDAYKDTDELLLEVYRPEDGRCPALGTMRNISARNEDYISRSARPTKPAEGSRVFIFAIPALRYATPYCFYVTQKTSLTFDTLLDNIRTRKSATNPPEDWFMTGFRANTYIIQEPNKTLSPLRDALRNWVTKEDAIRDYFNKTAILKEDLLDSHVKKFELFAPETRLLDHLDKEGFDTARARTLADAWSSALATAKKENYSESSLKTLKELVKAVQKEAFYAQLPQKANVPADPNPPAPEPDTAARVSENLKGANAQNSFMIKSNVAIVMDSVNALITARTSQDAASLNTLRDSFNKTFANSALVQVLTSSASTDALSYKERAGWYLSFDVGVLAPLLGESSATVTPYFGLNFYFAPVDKDVPLSVDGGLSKRFSLVAGITLGEVADTSASITGTAWSDSSRALLLGAGLRVTDYVRAGAGALFVRQADPNPVVSRQRLRLAPFVSLSVDVDMIGLIQDAFSSASAAF